MNIYIFARCHQNLKWTPRIMCWDWLLSYTCRGQPQARANFQQCWTQPRAWQGPFKENANKIYFIHLFKIVFKLDSFIIFKKYMTNIHCCRYSNHSYCKSKHVTRNINHSLILIIVVLGFVLFFTTYTCTQMYRNVPSP